MRKRIDPIELEYDASRVARVRICSANEFRQHPSDVAVRFTDFTSARMSKSSHLSMSDLGAATASAFLRLTGIHGCFQLSNVADALTGERTKNGMRCGIAGMSERLS